jgi:DNA-binding response OmpR family regulator
VAPRQVFLVEDEPDIALVVALCLDPARYAVDLAMSLAEARAYLASQPPPDVILLDVHLPDGDGLELCREVKATRPGVPVVVLTATARDWAGAAARAAGADAFVPKPFDPDDLCAVVARLLAA